MPIVKSSSLRSSVTPSKSNKTNEKYNYDASFLQIEIPYHQPIEHSVFFFNAIDWESKELFPSIHLKSYSLSYNGEH